MDTEACNRIIVRTLQKLPGPIRIPTARWLFSDLLGILDAEVNTALTEVIADGRVKQSSGGWLEVQ